MTLYDVGEIHRHAEGVCHLAQGPEAQQSVKACRLEACIDVFWASDDRMQRLNDR